MQLTVDDAANKGWWTWALKHGKPDHADADRMKKLLQKWEKEAGPQVECRAMTEKPSQVQKELEPFLGLKDHWQVCLVELILAERKGMYEAAREAFFRPFKVDDSTRTRRDYRTMKHTTTLYVQLLLRRQATAEAKRILDFMDRRYSLEAHMLAFERGMVFDAMEEFEEAYRWLARSVGKNRNAKKWLAEGVEIYAPGELYPGLRAEEGFDDFLKSPTRFLKKQGWEA